MNSILVTGGAGYIGSHVVRQLAERGERVVVLDNLSTGFREAVLGAELVVGDTADRGLLDALLKDHAVDTVMHFAAHTIVPESVSDPLKYYGNNTCATRNLLAACAAAGVRHFVFSSTAAVYGMPASGVADEDTPTQPINPYGSSKLMSEWMLRDLGAATSMRHAILRYFNVAGCDPQGRIGQSTPKATLLIKVACEHATGQRPHLLVNITNDDWFGKTAERYLHFALTVPRAIEHRVAFVRGTLTGVSAFVDPVGRIEAQTSPSDPETLVRAVPLLQSVTVYQLIGDAFAWLCLVLTLGFYVQGRWRRR